MRGFIALLLSSCVSIRAVPLCSELLEQVRAWPQSGSWADVVDSFAAGMDFAELSTCVEGAMKQAEPQFIAQLCEIVARARDCVAELATKSESETRCAQKWYKITITELWGRNDSVAATAAWQRALALRHGNSRIKWPSAHQVPTVWIPSLSSSPTWDCGHYPFMTHLEAASAQILSEMMSASQRFAAAYPYLSQRGSWENLFLFRGGKWDEQLCSVMKVTCRLLRPEFPTKAGVPWVNANSEEVVVFRSQPHTHVGPHCGASNSQVNLHLTLSGGSSATLRIGDQVHKLVDGKALCFQDSYLHAVEHLGSSERISIVIRAMHPEVSLASFAGMARTDVVELASWDSTAALRKEVARLRAEYRSLARDVSLTEGYAPYLETAEPLETCSAGRRNSDGACT